MENYESAMFMPMTDLEMQNVNGGGVPVVVFVLVAAVSVVGAAFVAAAGVGWDVAVGTNVLVATSTVNTVNSN